MGRPMPRKQTIWDACRYGRIKHATGREGGETRLFPWEEGYNWDLARHDIESKRDTKAAKAAYELGKRVKARQSPARRTARL